MEIKEKTKIKHPPDCVIEVRRNEKDTFSDTGSPLIPCWGGPQIYNEGRKQGNLSGEGKDNESGE